MVGILHGHELRNGDGQQFRLAVGLDQFGRCVATTMAGGGVTGLPSCFSSGSAFWLFCAALAAGDVLRHLRRDHPRAGEVRRFIPGAGGLKVEGAGVILQQQGLGVDDPLEGARAPPPAASTGSPAMGTRMSWWGEDDLGRRVLHRLGAQIGDLLVDRIARCNCTSGTVRPPLGRRCSTVLRTAAAALGSPATCTWSIAKEDRLTSPRPCPHWPAR